MPMAKNMSGVYAQKLTMELIKLREKHKDEYERNMESNSLSALARAETARNLLDQINEEIAQRVSVGWLKI